jgi:hypothetical protein
MRAPLLLSLGVLFANAAPVAAGMPSVTLTDAASMRLQSISFFLVVFFGSALVIRWIWNSLTTDFPRLPRLSYPKALGLVRLWGLLFLLTLTMISGAWKKDGPTYALGDAKTMYSFPAGLSNTILAGEVSSGFRARGAPLSSRCSTARCGRSTRRNSRS